LWHKRYCRKEQATGTNTDTDTLSQQYLVVLGSKASHYIAKYNHECPEGQKDVEVSRVKKRATNNPAEQEEEGLNRADPRD
jgi:hypothetical protein